MKITIITLFPEYFSSTLRTSVIGRALKQEHAQLELVDIRDFTDDDRRTADDRPYGGGPGMVLKPEPIARAIDSLRLYRDRHSAGESSPVQSGPSPVRTVLTSAKGELFTQQRAQDYSQLNRLVVVCGHYQGVDERVARHLVDEEVRIGDYVLTGGEPAAAVIIDAVVRLLPGVLGNESSTADESHSQPGLLGHPQYTRPAEFRGWRVPAELLTGDHAAIEAWRQNQRRRHD
ncbi:MAG: tRNA (guanosine(37)-N1)-methyltransferase TrmD [Candidatus Pacebacteria bacterium CG10_big_fil_rev_8_21_14_0_10_56_10]|nr:MAG: tRNA (guanosine(37)-N1)-methyltransferase TrmD [Candidatus Pacebacteria bacterium CG10_big_fil_rev_8_21_14_0_10_56_10]